MWENNQRLLPALSSGAPLMTALQIMSYADALECVREMCFSFFFFFFLVSPLALFYYIYLFFVAQVHSRSSPGEGVAH